MFKISPIFGGRHISNLIILNVSSVVKIPLYVGKNFHTNEPLSGDGDFRNYFPIQINLFIRESTSGFLGTICSLP